MKCREIRCSECEKRGRAPTLLGKLKREDQDGEFLLWCRNCKKEITVVIHNGQVKTFAEGLHSKQDI